MILAPLGDSAVIADLGEVGRGRTLDRVRRLAAALDEARPPGVRDVVAAYSTVAVFYELRQAARAAGSPHAAICQAIAEAAARAGIEVRRIRRRSAAASRIVVPVCYGGDFGPDLGVVAEHCKLSPEAVVSMHSSADYVVQAVGFLPGFPYLAGLPGALATPRRQTPRLNVPAGSVGIGGAQTGIYPMASPGGWQLIGRTPLALFSAAGRPPALVRAGDEVRFQQVSPEQFQRRWSAGRDAERQPPEAPEPEPGDGWIVVRRPGVLTTVQDLGRPGWRAAGVPPGGAADPFALRVANSLVGNPEDAAGLEVVLGGLDLEFGRESRAAVCGADCEGTACWKAIPIRAGGRLALGPCRSGFRAYVAVAGGIAAPAVLGGRGAFLRGGFGGLSGRALRAGDRLNLGMPRREPATTGRLAASAMPAYSSAPVLRVLRGAEAENALPDLAGREFRVSAQSDRMGLRLSGPAAVRRAAGDRVSSATAVGTIQVPPDGQPILLMADAQTIGGYPQAAHVASVDLPIAAQLRPGDRVRFREIALEEAERLALDREHDLAVLRVGLGL